MSVVTVLYLIGGLIAFFALIFITLITYIWSERKKAIDKQLELGEKAFDEQHSFNKFIKIELDTQKSIIEKQAKMFEDHVHEFGVWKAVVSKINRGVESFNKTNLELLTGIHMLVTKQNKQGVEVETLKKKISKLK